MLREAEALTMNWHEEKAAKRHERDMKKLERALAVPVSRGEAISRENMLLQNVASTAMAVEALESLLVERGILKDNEILDKMAALVKEKVAQVQAEQATEPTPSRIITPV